MSDKLHTVTRRTALALVAAFLVLQRSTAEAESAAILVHKDPNCSCCSGWVQHLKDAGFAVTVEETADLEPVKKRLKVPADLAACHTAHGAGYVLEGQVPPAALRRLLAHRPHAPGMA